MPFNYLPVFVEKAAPKPARKLKQVPPSRSAWQPKVPPLASARIALLTSTAVRTLDQPPFVPPNDATYRTIPADHPFFRKGFQGRSRKKGWSAVLPRHIFRSQAVRKTTMELKTTSRIA